MTKSNSSKFSYDTTAMATQISVTVAALCRSTYLPPTVPADPKVMKAYNAAIYEAYIFTCVAEAVEELSKKYPGFASIDPPRNPPSRATNLVLRKKACPIATASGLYSHVPVCIDGVRYELHTDTPTADRSSTLHELDVALIKESVCDKIRQLGDGDPTYEDVPLFVEAKCYTATLPLDISRAFLGLYSVFSKRLTRRSTTVRRNPDTYLVTTAGNVNASRLLGHTSRKLKWNTWFFPELNENASSRRKLVQHIAERLFQYARSVRPLASSAKLIP